MLLSNFSLKSLEAKQQCSINCSNLICCRSLPYSCSPCLFCCCQRHYYSDMCTQFVVCSVSISIFIPNCDPEISHCILWRKCCCCFFFSFGLLACHSRNTSQPGKMKMSDDKMQNVLSIVILNGHTVSQCNIQTHIFIILGADQI